MIAHLPAFLLKITEDMPSCRESRLLAPHCFYLLDASLVVPETTMFPSEKK